MEFWCHYQSFMSLSCLATHTERAVWYPYKIMHRAAPTHLGECRLYCAQCKTTQSSLVNWFCLISVCLLKILPFNKIGHGTKCKLQANNNVSNYKGVLLINSLLVFNSQIKGWRASSPVFSCLSTSVDHTILFISFCRKHNVFCNQNKSIWSCMCLLPLLKWTVSCIHGISSVIFSFVYFVLVSVIAVCNLRMSESQLPPLCCFSFQEIAPEILDAEERCSGSSKVPLFPAVRELFLLLPG